MSHPQRGVASVRLLPSAMPRALMRSGFVSIGDIDRHDWQDGLLRQIFFCIRHCSQEPAWAPARGWLAMLAMESAG
jgi:hypothetical protein